MHRITSRSIEKKDIKSTVDKNSTERKNRSPRNDVCDSAFYIFESS